MTVNIQAVNIWLNGLSYSCTLFNISAIPSILDGSIVVYYQIGTTDEWITNGNLTIENVDANTTTLNDVVNTSLNMLNLTRV